MRFEKITNFLIYLLLFILPWQTRYIWRYGAIANGPWEYGTFAIYATEILLWLVLILFAVGHFGKKEFWLGLRPGRPKKIFRILPILFFVLLAFSLLASRNFSVSYVFVFHLLEAMCLAAVIMMSRLDFKKAVLALWSAGVVQGMLAIWQFLAQKVYASKWLGMAEQLAKTPGTAAVEFGDERWLRAYGSFGWPNSLGIFLAAAMLLGIWLYLRESNRRNQIFIAVGQILIAAGLLLSFSRSAWLALAAGAAVLLTAMARQKKPELFSQIWKLVSYFLAAAAALVLIFYPVFAARFNLNNRLEQKSINERVQQYMESWQMIQESPWLGVGPGAYTYTAFLHDPNLGFWQYQPAHNIYVLMAAEIGLPAALLLILFLFGAAARAAKKDSVFCSLLITVFVFGLFDHWLWSLYGGMLFFWVILGLSLHLSSSQNTAVSAS